MRLRDEEDHQVVASAASPARPGGAERTGLKERVDRSVRTVDGAEAVPLARWTCGRRGHLARNCRASSATCQRCGGRHPSERCRVRGQSTFNGRVSDRDRSNISTLVGGEAEEVSSVSPSTRDFSLCAAGCECSVVICDAPILISVDGIALKTFS